MYGDSRRSMQEYYEQRKPRIHRVILVGRGKMEPYWQVTSLRRAVALAGTWNEAVDDALHLCKLLADDLREIP